jgi:hypothetical protein
VIALVVICAVCVLTVAAAELHAHRPGADRRPVRPAGLAWGQEHSHVRLVDGDDWPDPDAAHHEATEADLPGGAAWPR